MSMWMERRFEEPVSKLINQGLRFAANGRLLASVWLWMAPVLLAVEPPLPPITGAAAIVINRADGSVLGVKNPDQTRAMASTTKMMTALVAIEQNGSALDALVGPISAAAGNMGGTSMNLNPGDRVSLRELLYGLMLPSGNDAAVAIAEWVSGTEAAFVSLMNQRAQQLGLVNTAYVNAHGLDAAGHYSTARDLVALARFAMNNPLFAQLVRTVSYSPTTWVDASNNPRTETLSNSNLLLSSMPYFGADGVKNGWTSAAGFCLVASASHSDFSVMSVVLGCSSDSVRHTESQQLLDFGFSELGGLANGSFEQSYTDWAASGNQGVVTFGASHGTKSVRFNSGQTAPNAVLSQSFATTVGQSYTLSFDYGVSSGVGQREQRIQITVQGNSVLLSQLVSHSAFSSTVQYITKTYSFVADSSLTTLTFRDMSLITDSVDSFLDHVRMNTTLQLTAAASRKTHGSAGAFDIGLPLTGTPGVECRNGSGNHTLVFTFSNDVTGGSASVTSGTGSVTGSPAFSGKTMTVNLTGVANAQTLTIALANVSDGTATINASVAMGVLLGDVNGSGVVSGSDVNLTKAQQSKPIMADPNGNFRSDINLSGVISGSDVNQIKANNSSHL